VALIIKKAHRDIHFQTQYDLILQETNGSWLFVLLFVSVVTINRIEQVLLDPENSRPFPSDIFN
jgi:hypothetical protein